MNSKTLFPPTGGTTAQSQSWLPGRLAGLKHPELLISLKKPRHLHSYEKYPNFLILAMIPNLKNPIGKQNLLKDTVSC